MKPFVKVSPVPDMAVVEALPSVVCPPTVKVVMVLVTAERSEEVREEMVVVARVEVPVNVLSPAMV